MWYCRSLVLVVCAVFSGYLGGRGGTPANHRCFSSRPYKRSRRSGCLLLPWLVLQYPWVSIQRGPWWTAAGRHPYGGVVFEIV